MKKTFIYLAVLIILLACQSSAFAQEWVKTFKNLNTGDKDGEDKAYAMVIDSDGFIIVTGFSSGWLSGKDICTIKYKPDGDTLWVQSYLGTGTSEDKAYAITVDEMDNIYITGHSSGLNGYTDIITLKYSAAGELIWTKFFDGTAHTHDKGKVICADNSNNIYVAGFTTGLTSGSDYIIIKYDTAGTMLWNKTYNGTGNNTDAVTAIAVNNGITDCENFVVVSGNSRTGQTEETENIVTIVYKEQNGDVLWTKSFNGGEGNIQDKAYAITVDRDNAIYITGFSKRTSTAKDIFVLKYDYNGNKKWVSYYDENFDDVSYSIMATDNNNLLVCGSTKTSSQAGSEDYITLNYHTYNGSLKWSKTLNGPGNSTDEATNMIISKNSHYVYVTGYCSAGASSLRRDIITVKYKLANGNLEDSSRFNTNGIDENDANCIAIDEDGNIYISGFSAINDLEVHATSTIRSSYMLTLKYSGSLSNSPFKVSSVKNTDSKFKLSQNFPNPFNPSTVIKFNLTNSGFVSLKVYDMLGKEITVLVNEYLEAGEHSARFNSGNLSSGIYLYELNANGVKDIKKMILIK